MGTVSASAVIRTALTTFARPTVNASRVSNVQLASSATCVAFATALH